MPAKANVAIVAIEGDCIGTYATYNGDTPTHCAIHLVSKQFTVNNYIHREVEIGTCRTGKIKYRNTFQLTKEIP